VPPFPDGNAICNAWHHRADAAWLDPSFEYEKLLELPARPSTDTATGTSIALHDAHVPPVLVFVLAGIEHVNLLAVSKVKEVHNWPFTVIASGAICPTLPKLIPSIVSFGEEDPAAGPTAGVIDVILGVS